jgi:molybdenum cofactor cytidylyltransferase
VKTALLILAAGQSRRFGEANKLLAVFEGEPLIVRVARLLAGARSSAGGLAVTVVTRFSHDEVATALSASGLPAVSIVANPNAGDGIGTSISAGIASLAPEVSAALITPGDMPFVSAALVERLLAAFEADGGMRPACPMGADGTLLNPVVWPRRLFGKLIALRGDQGGKSILKHESVCTVAVEVDIRFLDIDTPVDLAALEVRSTAK